MVRPRTWARRGIGLCGGSRGPAADPCSGARLWLRRETRHGPLWTYGLRHLGLIRRHAGAAPRERGHRCDTGRKMTLAARLPARIKRAEHRDETLRAVGRLRESVLTRG
ncbi:hypothetical protein [Streptomyces sp. NPDC048191]|uniref:hypothetical protein n=1 Tax=Streptomyces sp. NPDC048191 TaxID=3155484 RepID=UPI00340B9201